MALGSTKGSFITLSLTLATLSFGLRAWAVPLPVRPLGAEQLSGLAVPFVENTGQIDPAVAYYAATFSGTVFVTRQGRVVYALPGGERGRRHDGAAGPGWSVTESFVGGHVAPVGAQPAATRASFFIGNDQTRWRTQMPTYSEVMLGEVYPGITVTLKAQGKQVEKILTVQPGASAATIRVRVAGAERLAVAADGSLLVRADEREAQLTPPLAYQEAGGQRQAVAVTYEIDGDTYGFRVAAYDTARPLVIDPLLRSTYLGGSGNDEVTSAVAIHPTTGDVYVAGFTASTDFAGISGGAGGNDAFVARLNASLTTLLGVTYLGGSLDDQAIDLAIHPATGDVYVFGSTRSTDFPIPAGTFYQMTSNGGTHYGIDAFVAHLNSDLTTLIGATYLGGTNDDLVAGEGAIGIDPNPPGDVFVTGDTWSTDFPGTTGGAQSTHAHADEYVGFIARLDRDLTTLAQATYLGGTVSIFGPVHQDSPHAIAITATGVYVASHTDTTDFPGIMFDSAQTTSGGGNDAAVTWLNAGLTAINRATYLGGIDSDIGLALAVNAAGDVYVAGFTDGPNFPTTPGAAQLASGGGYDFFVAQLKGDLTAPVLQATYFGGSGDEREFSFFISIGLAIHATTGDVYLIGGTDSTDLPHTTGGAQSTNAGGTDAFVARLNPDLRAVSQATYLGGGQNDSAIGIAINAAANEVYVAGRTLSTDFPATTSGAQSSNAGSTDGFVARFSADLAAPIPTATPTPTTTPTPTATATCVPAPAACGDGVREVGEGCDKGSPNCDLTTCTCPPGGPDTDGDGVPDACDNCPGAFFGDPHGFNPDQRNSDCPLGSLPTFPGCTDGGDVCDACPADASNGCDPTLSGGKNVGPAGATLCLPGSLLSDPMHCPPNPSTGTTPPNGTIIVTVPPSAVCENASISVTNKQNTSTGTSFIVHPAKLALRPNAMHFSVPVVVTVGWADRDNDGIVDEGVCSNNGLTCDHGPDCGGGSCTPTGNLTENVLTLRRNSSEFSQNGFGCSGSACECSMHDPAIIPATACATAQANCGPGGPAPGTGTASVANCCSVANNTWTFQTCDFSTQDIAEHATDLISGAGSVTTDCFAEWNVENPNSRPIDHHGLVTHVQACTDGEVGCDGDGQVNGVCVFHVGVCLNNEDSRLVKNGLPACPVTDVATWELKKPRPDSSVPADAASAVALRDAVAALAPASIGGSHQERVVFSPAFATTDVCTSLVSTAVALHNAGRSPGKAILKSVTRTSAGAKDADSVKLICRPPP